MSRQKLLIIVAVVIVFTIIILIFGIDKNRQAKPVTLEFWGVYDDLIVYSELIDVYQKENKHITIKYQKRNFEDYEKELINAFAAGEGPDIFSIHHTWVPKHKDKIEPMPEEEGFFTPRTFKNIFVDVVYQDFVRENKIYAISLYVDTLALYFNKDFFNSAGIPLAPTNWDEFLSNVEQLTERDQWGNIKRSGVAIGTAENVNRSTDILSLLMLQTGAEMIDEAHTSATFNREIRLQEKKLKPGLEALRFYTDFSNPTKQAYSWNRQMPFSIDAFYEGKSAMMINYSYHINTIKTKSPYFNFDVAPVPQIKDRDFDVNYANYWAQTVSKASKNIEEAWKFLIFLSKKENLKKYSEASKRPTSRRDLIEWQREDDELGIFADQALSAQSWYQIDNQAIEKIFEDMVKSVVLGETTIEQAINQAVDKITILMR